MLEPLSESKADRATEYTDWLEMMGLLNQVEYERVMTRIRQAEEKYKLQNE